MVARRSAYAQFPGYRVALEPAGTRVRATAHGVTIADSDAALRVLETRHRPVYYFPRRDVRIDLLRPTDHHTFCPFKGEASYFDIAVGGETTANAVWTYEEPFEEVAGLEGYLAFYEDRVAISPS